MKKVLLILLSMLLALSLAACGGNSQEVQIPEDSGETVDSAEVDPAQITEEPEDLDFGEAPVYAGSDVVNTILSGHTAREFAGRAVEDDLLRSILESGNQATSARNTQPWRFTVVRDAALVGQIVRDLPAGPVAIVVSGVAAPEEGVNPTLDCALATQNMYIAAQSLGLGAHIYTGPVSGINENLRDTLSIPSGYNAVAVLVVGYEEAGVDAVSSASQRNPLDAVVNYAD